MSEAPDGTLWAAVRQLVDQVGRLEAKLERDVRQLRTEVRALRQAGEVLDDGTLRRADAAKLLGYSLGTLNRMATRGEGPPFVRFRGRTYYRRDELEAWRAQHQRTGAPARAQKNVALPLFGATD